jgi:hypothetical protein
MFDTIPSLSEQASIEPTGRKKEEEENRYKRINGSTSCQYILVVEYPFVTFH